MNVNYNKKTNSLLELDRVWMQEALKEAKRGEKKGEAPIGCVIVKDGKIIARAHNTRESKKEPLGHAELNAIRKAAKKVDAWRLLGTTIYVTLEPCAMCMGGIILSRIERVVFGAFDPKAGAAGSIYNFAEDSRFNHRVDVTSRVLEKECSEILTDFFRELRRKKLSH